MSQPSFFDQALFTELAEKAAASPRARHHHNFHQMQEPCHRLAVGMQPDTYIAPHRHLSSDKAETVIVLRGCLGLLIFSETGELLSKRVMRAGGDCLGADLPPGVFHSFVVLETDTLMFECKAGPYRPLSDAELAHWAPREGEAGMVEYQAWMRAQFD